MPATVASRRVRRYCSAVVAVAIALLGTGIAGSASSADPGAAADRPTTASPIKHVIVVIGENQSFDHLYGTHVPPSGDSISNLLVKGIVRPDGSPGPYFAKAQQFTTAGQNQLFHLCRHEEQDPLHHPAGPNPERGAEQPEPDISALHPFRGPAGSNRAVLGTGQLVLAHNRSHRCRRHNRARSAHRQRHRSAERALPADRS